MKIDKYIHFIWFGNLLKVDFIYKINKIAKMNSDYKVILWISKRQLLQDLVSLSLDSESQAKSYYIQNLLPGVQLHYIESLENNYKDINQEFIFNKAIQYIYSEISINANFIHTYHDVSGNIEKRSSTGRNYAAGADLARMLILYIFGGVYSDLDNKFKRRIGDFYIKEKYTKIIVDRVRRKDTYGNIVETNLLNNNIIATVSKNEFFLEALKVMSITYDKMHERNYINEAEFKYSNLFDGVSLSEFRNYEFKVVSNPNELKLFSYFTNQYIGLINKRNRLNKLQYVNITCEISGPYFFKKFIPFYISKKSYFKKYNLLKINDAYKSDPYLFKNLVIDNSYVEHEYEYSWMDAVLAADGKSLASSSYKGINY